MRIRYSFRLIGYVVMPEHAHLLLSEPATGDISVMGQFELWVNEKLPAQKAGGLDKIYGDKALRFCRGLSVPFFSGQRGHVYFQTDPLPTFPSFCRY